MQGRIPVKQTALTLGILFALLHALWALVVASGMGRSLAESMMGLHFITLSGNVYYVQPFNAGTAVMLVVAGFIGGAIVGALFALVWNWVGAMHEERSSARRRR